MSGLNIPYLSELVFGLSFIALGVLQLLPPSTVTAQIERRAGTLKLRYGDGGVDLPARREESRWPGLVMIALGAAHIVWPRPNQSEWVLMLVMAALAFGVALLNLFLGARFDARRQRRYEADLDQLAGRRESYSDETYKEELRALQATRPTFVSPQRNLIVTGCLIVLGGAYLALGIAGARQ